MSDGQIDIEVSLNSSQAEQQAKKLGNQLGSQISKNVDSAVKNTGKSTQQAISEIGTGMAAFGASYSKAVTLPIAAAAVASGAAAVKVDTALTGVRKTVDATEEEYQRLKQAAIEFSQTNPVDPATILDIQALGAQLGYLPSELQGFSETIAKLGASTNMTFEEAATELAQFSNIMGMAHDDTERYGSTIVALGNSFATTESDISHMAMRIAGAGKQIGLSEADVLGLATALSSMGIEAEAGGTAISTIMSQIDKDVALGTDNLKTWADTANMSVDEFTQAWGTNAVDALSAVLVGMDNATQSGGNMAVMLDELGITSIRQTDVLKRLASNSGFLGDAVHTANKAWEENIALDKEVENRNNSMAAKLQILWNKIQAVAIEVGEPLMDALLDVIDAGEPLVQMLADGAKAFADMSKDEQQMVLKTVAVVAAIGPVTSGIGKLLTSVTGGANAWKAFSNNLSTVKNNLARATTSTAAASASWGKYFQVVRNGESTIYKVNRTTGTYQQTNSKLGKVLATTTVGIKAQDTAMKLANASMRIGSTVAKAFSTALKTIAPVAGMAAIVEVIGHISGSLSDASDHASEFKKQTEGVSSAASSFNSAFESAVNSVDDYTESLDDLIEKNRSALNSQTELSDSLNQLFTEAGTNAGLVKKYSDTIAELGEKGNLTAAEQVRLQTAVEGINSVMGTSYSIIDGQTGRLSENKNMILATAEAWRENAKAQAQQEALIELEKQNAIATAQLESAKAQLDSTEKGLYVTMGGVEILSDEQGRAYNELSQQVTDLEASIAANDTAIQSLSSAMESNVSSANSSTDALSAWFSELEKSGEASEGFAESLQNVEGGADAFIETLSQIGVSTDELSNILSTQGQAGIDALIAAYNGGSDTLMEWAVTNIPEIGNAIAESLSASSEPISASASEMMENATSSAEESLNAGTESIFASSQEYGDSVPSGMADGVSNGASEVSSAIENLTTQAASEATGAAAQFQAAGAAIPTSMAGGISASGGAVGSAAAGIVANAVAPMTAGTGQATAAGNQMGSGLSSGISSTSGKATAAGSTLTKNATNSMNQGVNQSRQIGNRTGEGYANGMRSVNTRTVGSQLAQNAVSGLNEGSSGANSSGANLGQGFIDGMSSKLSGVIAQARSLAQAAVDEIRRVGQEGSPWKTTIRSGQFAAEGLAIGMENREQMVVQSGRDMVRSTLDAMRDEVANDKGVVFEFDEKGQAFAKGIIVGFETIDPMSQINSSIMNGVSALTIATQSAGVTNGNSYNTNNQTINFNSPVSSPDEIARTMRMQQHYGLAGRY